MKDAKLHYSISPLCACLRKFGKFHGAERIANIIAPQSRFPAEHSVILNLQGQQMRVWPRSRVGWNLCLFGTYDPQLRRLMRQFITPGSSVVDAGANIGWHTILAAKLTGESGVVHAFEPNPSVLGELSFNLDLNTVSNVTPWNVALSDHAGTAKFAAPFVGSLGAGDGRLCSSADDFAMADTLTVDLAVLDSLDLGNKNLSFIKIDVEGHELPLLRGALGMIESHHPVIAFEHLNGSSSGTTMDLVQLLSTLDYRLFGYDDRRPPFPLRSLNNYSGDVLAVSRRATFNPLKTSVARP